MLITKSTNRTAHFLYQVNVFAIGGKIKMSWATTRLSTNKWSSCRFQWLCFTGSKLVDTNLVCSQIRTKQKFFIW